MLVLLGSNSNSKRRSQAELVNFGHNRQRTIYIFSLSLFSLFLLFALAFALIIQTIMKIKRSGLGFCGFKSEPPPEA